MKFERRKSRLRSEKVKFIIRKIAFMKTVSFHNFKRIVHYQDYQDYQDPSVQTQLSRMTIGRGKKLSACKYPLTFPNDGQASPQCLLPLVFLSSSPAPSYYYYYYYFQTFITLTEGCSVGQRPLQNRPKALYRYKLYKIQPTGPARRLATQQVGYDQHRKSTAAALNSSHTHNIIPLLAPDEFNVILRTTTDEFNVIPRTYPGLMPCTSSSLPYMHHNPLIPDPPSVPESTGVYLVERQERGTTSLQSSRDYTGF